MSLNRSLRAAGFVFVFSTFVLFAQTPRQSVSNGPQQTINKCAELFGALPGNSDPLREDLLTMSRTEKAKAGEQRVCFGTYAFPGGEKAFAAASSDAIKADRARFQAIFDYYGTLSPTRKRILSATPHDDTDARLEAFHAYRKLDPDISPNDWVRLVDISQGADKQQVLLYGQFMYMKALRKEGSKQKCALIFDEMRRSGNLSFKVHQLDWMEQHTYLTSQALQNLIGAEGYAAKASLPSAGLKKDAELAADFLDSLPALSLIFTSDEYIVHVEDPSEAILTRLAVLKPATLGQVRDELTAVGAVAGLIQEEDGTTVFLQGTGRLHAVEVSTSGEVSALSRDDAAANLTSFNQRQVVEHSTADMTLYNVMKYRDGTAEIDLGGNLISLSADDVKHLRSGQRLADSHPLTLALKADSKAKVMYANVLMQKSGDYLKDGDELTFALRKCYPEVNIYRDPLSEQTNQRVKDLAEFAKTPAKNVTAIVDDDSFKAKVQDFDLVKSVKASLQAAGVEVLTYHAGGTLPQAQSKGKGLIVITAHSNEALARFVDQLGSQGIFEGNYVLFNSCGTSLTRSLADRINTQYKAEATFTYRGNVPVQSMKTALNSLSESLRAGSSFNDAITKALKESDLNGVWHVSEIDPGVTPLSRPAGFGIS